MRTVSQLRIRASELRSMAQTARTADMQTDLMVLAERFEALAVKRSVELPIDHRTDDTRRD
jgi:hypothetical protein